ncbi:MAG: phospholipase D-like domain-containing protein [bacterium]
MFRKKGYYCSLAVVGVILILGTTGLSFASTDVFVPRVVQTYPAETNLQVEGINQTHQAWKKLISSAEEKIQIGVFYMIDNPSGRLTEILDKIEAKVREGVRLEVVSDTNFYQNYPGVIDRLAKLENSDVRIIDLNARTGGIMHAKYFLVDDRHFYVGSANYDWRSLKHIREIGLMGTSREIVEQLQMIYAVDFELASRSDTEQWSDWRPLQPEPDYRSLESDTFSPGSDTLLVTATPPSLTPAEIVNSEAAILKLINSARDEIFIDLYKYGLTSPYSSGYYDEIDRALRRAAARGVEVHLLVAEGSLAAEQLPYLKSLQHLPQVEVRFLKIPIAGEGYRPYSRTSHPKLLVVDRSLAWLGSANWEPGYFSQSRNVGLVTAAPGLVKDLRRFFLTAWTGPYSKYLDPAEEYSPPYNR